MHSSQFVVRTQPLPQGRELSSPLLLTRRFSAGEVLAGKYRLDRLVGEGAMGEVWLGENVLLEMPVALKLLRRETFRDGGTLPGVPEALSDRLIVEARTTAKLLHAGIVRILDFGTDRGYPFLVLERLDGEDLRARLTREGPMPQADAVRLVLPIIDAVHFAHTHGIVHRDLKPENVFLVVDEAGRLEPKVLDFGVASLRSTEVSGAFFVAGTLPYMAPEQLEGRTDADHRVDVYAVSVMLLELVTGKHPFDAANALQPSADAAFFVPAQVGALDLLWQADPKHLAPKLADILVRGLAPSPRDRWASMRVFGQALAEWLLQRGVEDDVRGRSLRSHWLDDGVDVVFPIEGQAEPLPAPTPPARPVTAFVDDPIVVPKKRSWAGLGAVGAIVVAALLSVAVAFDVTSPTAVRDRFVHLTPALQAAPAPSPEDAVPEPGAAPVAAAIEVTDLPDAAPPAPSAAAGPKVVSAQSSPARSPMARKAPPRRAASAVRAERSVSTTSRDWGLDTQVRSESPAQVEPAAPRTAARPPYLPDGI